MRFNNERVQIDTIDANDIFYLITTEKNIEELIDSIKDIGLLHPPLLFKKNSSYRIVSGFRRISALTILGFSQVDAWILNDVNDDLKIVKIAITENALQRSLNIVEKARSIKLLSTCIHDGTELARVANAVGVSCDTKLIAKLLKISDLTESVQKGLIDGYISMPIALMLNEYDDDTTDIFVEIFKKLHPGLNRQRELITLISEIVNRDDIDIASFIKEQFFTEVMKDEELDRNLKIQTLLTRLKRIRYPEISKAENNFKRRVINLKIGNGMKLIPPKQFESMNYMFQLTFKNLEEIESILSELNQVIKDPRFERILDR